MKRAVIFLVFFLLFPVMMFSQDEEIGYSQVPNIIPPLPQSQIYEKYLNHEIEEYNGIPEITIPLYDIELKGMKIPVYLSYHASGIKFRQCDGEVGAGWMLNIGGYRVMRRVFGKEDEKYPLYSETAFAQSGSYDFYRANAYMGNILFPQYLEDYQSSIINSYSFGGRQDSGYDLFSFNLPTASGQFIIADRSTGAAEIVDRTCEKIEWNSKRITDENGNIYHFSDSPDLVEYREEGHTTAWPVVKVVTSKGEIVTMTYISDDKNGQNEYLPPDVDIREAATLFDQSDSFEDAAVYETMFPESHLYNEILLNEIKTDNLTLSIVRDISQTNLIKEIKVVSKADGKVVRKVVFDHTLRASVDEGHTLLKSLTIYGDGTDQGKKYEFEYYGAPEYPCPDMWGYYTSFNKTGMTHTFGDEIFLHNEQRDLRIKTNSNSGVTTAISDWQYGGYNWWADRTSETNIPHWYSLKKITFPTGGTTEYTYESHRFKKTDGSVVKGGGIRVSRIESTSDDMSEVITNYYYGDGKANLELELSSFKDERLFYTIETENIALEDISRCNRHIALLVQSRLAEASDFKVRYERVQKVVEYNSETDRYGWDVTSWYHIPDEYVMGEVEHHCFPRNDEIRYDQTNCQVKTYYPGRRPYLKRRAYYDGEECDTVKVEAYLYRLTDSSTYNGVKLYQQAFFNNYFEDANSYQHNASTCVYSYFDYLKYSLVTGTFRLVDKSVVGEITETDESYHYDANNQLVSITSLLSDDNPDAYRMVEYVYSRNNPDMLARNMVGDILEKTVTQNDIVVEKTRIDYQLSTSNDLILPYQVYRYLNGSQNPQYVETYSRYDGYGNPVSVISSEGLETVYLWGYNGMYPIAEIRNATHTDVETVVKSVFGVSGIDALSSVVYDASDRDSLIGKFRELREHTLLEDAMITGYTYTPLIGMTSVTEPSGRTVYYSYDAGGSLCEKYYMDGTEKCVIESYEYNYRND